MSFCDTENQLETAEQTESTAEPPAVFPFSTGNDFKKVELFKVELNSYLLNFIKNLKTVKIECSYQLAASPKCTNLNPKMSTCNSSLGLILVYL